MFWKFKFYFFNHNHKHITRAVRTRGRHAPMRRGEGGTSCVTERDVGGRRVGNISWRHDFFKEKSCEYV